MSDTQTLAAFFSLPAQARRAVRPLVAVWPCGTRWTIESARRGEWSAPIYRNGEQTGVDVMADTRAELLSELTSEGATIIREGDEAPAADAAPVVTLDVDHKGKPYRTRNLSGQGHYNFAAHANVDHKGKGYRAAIYQTGYRIPAAEVEVTLYLNGRTIPEAHLAAVRAAVVTAYNAAFINAPLTILPGTVEFLKGGNGARRTHGRVTLAVEGDEFVLSAPGATPHRLAISATSATRLDAHWQAYCEAHSEAPAADATPPADTVVYRLGSVPMCRAPGVLAWAINGAKFPRDLPQMVRVISDGWGLPYSAAEALVTEAMPHTIEGETVVFPYSPAAHAALMSR